MVNKIKESELFRQKAEEEMEFLDDILQRFEVIRHESLTPQQKINLMTCIYNKY